MIRRDGLTNAPNKTRIALTFGAEREKEREVVGGVDNFLDLTDTPATYEDGKGKWVSVKNDEKGLEFTAYPGLGLTYIITISSIILLLLSPSVSLRNDTHTIVLPNPSYQMQIESPYGITLENPTVTLVI